MIIGEFAITREGTRYIFGTQDIEWPDFFNYPENDNGQHTTTMPAALKMAGINI